MSDKQALVRTRRQWAFKLILALFLVVALEVIAYFVIALGPSSIETDRAATRLERFSAGAQRALENRAGAIAEFHESLGWRPNVGLANEETRINTWGLRSSREYAPEPAEGVLRVAAFGDSFVYGHEVGLADAWPTMIEASAPDIEVLNFGVTGYGPDQAYLRFSAEAASLRPSVVIWAVSPWMLNRLVSVYRPFLTQGDEFGVKPRYAIDEDGTLTLIPQPVARRSDARIYVSDPDAFKRLGEYDHFYEAAVYENPLHDWSASVRLITAIGTKLERRHLDPNRILTGPPGKGVFSTQSEAFRIAVALMLRFDSETRAFGAIPIVMTIPDIHSVRRAREGIPTIGSPLIAACREAGLTCWNLADAFKAEDEEAPIAAWFMPGGHYSPEGNAVAARWMETRLRVLPGR